MKIILVGLGKMGSQIAHLLQSADHQIIAFDENYEAASKLASYEVSPAKSRDEAINILGDDKAVVWLMIPAQFIDQEIDRWLDILPKNSILIDGGNTNFRQTINHAKLANNKSIKFLDIGVSGGILGLKNGFSMMVGGDNQAYQEITPILDVLAGPSGGHEYFGKAGSGHYIKMVHNAIEYGMMESLAEGYQMLHSGPYDDLDLAKAAAIWQKSSVIESTLNQLLAEALKEDQKLNGIDGFVAESGEARWTLEEAEKYSINLPAIKASFDVRLASQQGDISFATKLLAVLRNKFGGHMIQKPTKNEAKK